MEFCFIYVMNRIHNLFLVKKGVLSVFVSSFLFMSVADRLGLLKKVDDILANVFQNRRE